MKVNYKKILSDFCKSNGYELLDCFQVWKIGYPSFFFKSYYHGCCFFNLVDNNIRSIDCLR